MNSSDLRGIKRYSIGCHEDSQHYGEVTESEDGCMVYWDDVVSALSDSGALVKELATELLKHIGHSGLCCRQSAQGEPLSVTPESCRCTGINKSTYELLNRPEVRRILKGNNVG